MSNTDKKIQIEDPNKPDAPEHEHGLFEKAKQAFAPHSANPGPAVHDDMKDVPHEGTKEERLAKAKELNK